VNSEMMIGLAFPVKAPLKELMKKGGVEEFAK
jgi:hypothetical protein